MLYISYVEWLEKALNSLCALPVILVGKTFFLLRICAIIELVIRI